MALGVKSAHKAEQGVLCSFLSSLLAARIEANTVRYMVCGHHPGVKIPKKLSNSQIFQKSIRLGRHIPLTLGKLDNLFPRQDPRPSDMARESPTQSPVSQSLVSTPWPVQQSCSSVPTLWCSRYSFTDIWSVTDDMRCLRTLKPTLCVSLRPILSCLLYLLVLKYHQTGKTQYATY